MSFNGIYTGFHHEVRDEKIVRFAQRWASGAAKVYQAA